MSVDTALAQEVITINPRYAYIKRLCDIIFTLLFLLPFIILYIIVATAIKLDSDGTILYRQKRIGLQGKEFYMYKFRSMYQNSDDAIHRRAIDRYMNGKMVNEYAPYDISYKQADDPRITRVGRFIRRCSLDELPQFINVLRGEMTLVGPRPPLPYEYERYSARERLRMSGKPGLTGLWQVYGRSRVPFHTMVAMDIAYLQHQSLKEDLKLIGLTIPVMLQGRGGA